jgi:hypothetical protein
VLRCIQMIQCGIGLLVFPAKEDVIQLVFDLISDASDVHPGAGRDPWPNRRGASGKGTVPKSAGTYGTMRPGLRLAFAGKTREAVDWIAASQAGSHLRHRHRPSPVWRDF